VAAVEAALRSPLRTIIGYGAVDTNTLLQPFLAEGRQGEGTHNVYFRMLLTAGITGLVAYLGLQAAAIDSLRAVESLEEQAVVGLLITYVVADVFIAASVFGFSTDTFLLASSTGYALRIAASNTLEASSVAPTGS
jgi:O-antigen ligase